jgi:hypothetical protein
MATFDIDINADTSGAVGGLTTLEREVIETSDSVKTLEKQLKELGEQSAGLDKNSKEFKKLNSEIIKTSKELEKSKKSLSGLNNNLGKVSKGFKGLGLAIKATGIGLIIAGFSALKRILESQQPVLDAIDTAFTAIGMVISTVSDVLTSVFKAQSDANGGFDAATKVIKNLMTIALAPFKLILLTVESAVVGAQLAWEKSFFGGGDEGKIAELEGELDALGQEFIDLGESVLEAGTAISDNIGEAITEVSDLASAVVDGIAEIDTAKIISDAKATTALKNRAKIAEAINKGILEQYDRIAEKDRQVRDDVTLSLNLRIEANNRLGETLKEQEKLMLRNARLVVSSASSELKANDNIENQVALINARNEVKAVEATIEGFRSEQLINQQGLQIELNDLNQIAIDRTIERGIIEREFNAQSIQDKIVNLAIEEEIETKRLQNIIDSLEENTLLKVTAEQDLFDKQLELAQTKAELDEELRLYNEDLESQEAEKREQSLQKQLDDEKRLRDAKFETANVSLQIATDVTDSINGLSDLVFDIAEKNGKQDEESKDKRARKRFNVNKALQLSGAIIDTAKAVSTSLASAPLAIGPIPNPAGIASLAITAVSGAVSIAKIASTKYKSTSTGGGGSSPVSIPSAGSSNINTSGPTSTFVGTGGNTGGGDNNQAGSNQQPIIIQNNILESDITNAQTNVASIEEFATFGGG